ncbi:hypothetical protein KQI36_14715 [Clostridium senegalense]|uniref:hypothetical protein n=1 Tax=Clostridium senegalense TaxID=1465809 RepID=UPI001C1006BE|nr:hypothetical protein [Clostridium senegalense]MBU5227881.1 hypothetical protein [Clostridium senegalense]
MIQKFKNLSKKGKISVGIIAFLFLPITLLILGMDLLINGIKTKKIGKSIGGGALILIMILGLALSNRTNTELAAKLAKEPVKQVVKNEGTKAESKEAVKEKSKQEETTLSNEELLAKLETYEGIYAMIPSAIQEASQSNDKLQMQKTFSDSNEVLKKCWLELQGLLKQFDNESDQYKTVNNLSMSFFTLKDACKNGITYLDKNEFKYYEKFEKCCNEAGAWLNDYMVYKEKLK